MTRKGGCRCRKIQGNRLEGRSGRALSHCIQRLASRSLEGWIIRAATIAVAIRVSRGLMPATGKDAPEAEILQRLQTDPFRADRHWVLVIHAVEIYPDDRRFRKEGLPAWVSLRCPALTAPERLSGEAGFGMSGLGDAQVPERPESGPYRPFSAIWAGPRKDAPPHVLHHEPCQEMWLSCVRQVRQQPRKCGTSQFERQSQA